MIELKNLSKSYTISKEQTSEALRGIDLKIKEGELVILKGASGSGKSTILSLIAALSKPTSGDVLVDGKNIAKLSDDFAALYRGKNIGFVFQKYNLLANLSVAQNITLPLIPLNPPLHELEAKLESVMQMFHIGHKKDVMVSKLSGGEQQRVAIARACINDPKIILADEPTANLDKTLSLHFIEILKELKTLQKTIIVATHDPLFFGLDFVDREIEIADGELI
ncbi:MAG: ABC transporter ATP-binding protein [Sulfurimonas sp.]|jgi:putative ABC transport system ATP-binding protein|nr:ABC transporter ATP-binding protein [Sulfurimonas sp.]